MNNVSKQKFNISQIVLEILIFLACFNFLGRGPVVFFVFCIYAIITTRKVSWNATCVLYLLLSAAAVIASIIYFDANEIVKSLMYFLSFIAGYRLIPPGRDNSKAIRRLIFFATLGCVAYLAYVAYLNIIMLGHSEGYRIMINPWNGAETPATIFGMLSCVPISYSFYTFFCQDDRKLKLIGALFLAIALVINIETATRTPFVLMGIVYAVTFIAVLRSHNNKANVRIIIIVILALVLWNTFLVSDFAGTVIYERFTEDRLESSRWDIMNFYIDHMLEYPWGGSFVEKNYNTLAHNLLQESYDTYGVFFFIPLIFVFGGVFIRYSRLFAVRKKTAVSFLILAMYLGVFLQLMMEPVIVGYPQLIWFFFMIDGFVVSGLKRKDEAFFPVYN